MPLLVVPKRTGWDHGWSLKQCGDHVAIISLKFNHILRLHFKDWEWSLQHIASHND